MSSRGMHGHTSCTPTPCTYRTRRCTLHSSLRAPWHRWHGIPAFVDVDGDDGHASAHRSTDWRELRFYESTNRHTWPSGLDRSVPRPPYWERAVADAALLARDFPFVRLQLCTHLLPRPSPHPSDNTTRV